ncbi:MAG: MFS transporter, partial [Spirochaetia bacterium]
IIVSVATEPLVSAFANPQRGYFFVALIYGSLAFVFFQVCFAATKRIEIHPTAHRENYTLKQSIKIIGKNSQLLILTGAFLVGATAEYIRETSAIYYVAYNLGNSSLLPAFMGTVVLSMIIANLIIPAVTRKIDKKGTYYAGTVIAAAASLVFHFIPFDNLPLILTFAAISSFGLTVVSTLGWSMLPDTVEYGQALTGVRTEGVIYSFFSFSQKLATALAGAIVAITLQLTEYVPKQPVQGDAALTGILSTLTFIPIGLILLSALILKFYKLDKEHFDKLKTQLNAEETPPE